MPRTQIRLGELKGQGLCGINQVENAIQYKPNGECVDYRRMEKRGHWKNNDWTMSEIEFPWQLQVAILTGQFATLVMVNILDLIPVLARQWAMHELGA